MSENLSEPLIDQQEHQNPVLNREQINYARQEIEQRHGLLDTDIMVVWPFWKYIFCCRKQKPKQFKLALKHSIRKKLDIKISKIDKLIERDPYLLLGYGMNSYFTVMLQLLYLCALICIVMIPLSLVYASAGGDFTGMNAYTLGNLGGSSVFCTQSAYKLDGSSTAISCPANSFVDMDGVGQNGEVITSVGMISSDSPIQNYCSASAIADAPDYDCSSYLLTDSFLAAMRTHCQGLDTCEISDLSDYVGDTTNAPEGCKMDSTQIFLQVACLIPED